MPDPHVNQITWTYDNLGRLTDEVFNHYDDLLDQTQHFSLDLVGNRLEKTTDTANDGTVDETISYTYDNNDRLLTESNDSDNNGTVDTTTSYSYTGTTQTGKTVTDIATSQVTSQATYNYDLQGRMSVVISETLAAGVVARRERTTFDYEDEGIRVTAKHEIDTDGDGTYDSETTTTYLNDPNNHTGYSQILEETIRDSAGNVVKTKVYTLGSDILAQTTFEQGSPLEGTTLFFLYDGHGSTRILTDVAAAIGTVGGAAQIFHYDAYGNAIGFDPAAAATTLLYSGEQFDSAINQQYLRARYYDVATGRFNRVDPFAGNTQDPQSLHKYLYAKVDPVNNTDPSGQWTLGSITIAAGNFVGRVQANTAAVFAAGGATLGRFFNLIGARAQQFAHHVISLFGQLRVEPNRPVGQRIIDFIVKNGDRVAQIEAKYSIPARLGRSFDRLVGQINAMVTSGQGQPVVWSLLRPTVAQLNRVKNAVGVDVFNQVQFVDGIWRLHQYIKLYFGF